MSWSFIRCPAPPLGRPGARMRPGAAENELKEAALRIARSDFETLKYILSLIMTIGQRGAWAAKRTLNSSQVEL